MDLDKYYLTSGPLGRGNKLCIMQLVDRLRGDERTRPRSVPAPLVSFMVGINDTLVDSERQRLKPLAPILASLEITQADAIQAIEGAPHTLVGAYAVVERLKGASSWTPDDLEFLDQVEKGRIASAKQKIAVGAITVGALAMAALPFIA